MTVKTFELKAGSPEFVEGKDFIAPPELPNARIVTEAALLRADETKFTVHTVIVQPDADESDGDSYLNIMIPKVSNPKERMVRSHFFATKFASKFNLAPHGEEVPIIETVATIGQMIQREIINTSATSLDAPKILSALKKEFERKPFESEHEYQMIKRLAEDLKAGNLNEFLNVYGLYMRMAISLAGADSIDEAAETQKLFPHSKKEFIIVAPKKVAPTLKLLEPDKKAVSVTETNVSLAAWNTFATRPAIEQRENPAQVLEVNGTMALLKRYSHSPIPPDAPADIKERGRLIEVLDNKIDVVFNPIDGTNDDARGTAHLRALDLNIQSAIAFLSADKGTSNATMKAFNATPGGHVLNNLRQHFKREGTTGNWRFTMTETDIDALISAVVYLRALPNGPQIEQLLVIQGVDLNNVNQYLAAKKASFTTVV